MKTVKKTKTEGLPKRQTKPNVHKGHRMRVKEQYKKHGLDIFADHVVLELLLYFGIPYKDTNETAHELISRFGDISAVFEADIDSLKSVKNMTDNAAVLIHLIGSITRRYYMSKSREDGERYHFSKIKDYLLNRYIGINEETVFLLLFDKNDRMIDCIKINEGYTTVSEVKIGKIAKIANLHNVRKVAISHNHLNGEKISNNDVVSTRQIAYHLKIVDIELMESFVVSGNKVYEICKAEKVYRK